MPKAVYSFCPEGDKHAPLAVQVMGAFGTDAETIHRASRLAELLREGYHRHDNVREA